MIVVSNPHNYDPAVVSAAEEAANLYAFSEGVNTSELDSGSEIGNDMWTTATNSAFLAALQIDPALCFDLFKLEFCGK